MKLQQSSQKIKTSFLQTLVTDYTKKLIERHKYDNNSVYAENKSFSEHNTINLLDRFGRIQEHNFSGKNICIVADDKIIREKFCEFLCNTLNNKGVLLQKIKPQHFACVSNNPKNFKLITSFSSEFSAELIRPIFEASDIICVFKLKNHFISCPLNCTIKTDHINRNLIKALDGETHLRNLFIASLEKDEFVLIEKDQQLIRKFKEIRS